jgi:uncharacterized membrane protein
MWSNLLKWVAESAVMNPDGRVLSRGRLLFYVLASALVVLVLATLSQLPPLVASHFDARGAATGWLPRPLYALFLLAIGILIPLGITGLITLLTRSGVSALNIPARDYWTRPEHSGEAVRRVRAYMWWLACVLVVTALAIHWSVLAANARQPTSLNTGEFFTVLGAIVLALGIWTAGWYRLLRREQHQR